MCKQDFVYLRYISYNKRIQEKLKLCQYIGYLKVNYYLNFEKRTVLDWYEFIFTHSKLHCSDCIVPIDSWDV